MSQPDPNITGPCQLQASPDCDGAGRQRLDPMAMLDFRDHVMACLACYETRAGMFVAAVHAPSIQVNDEIRLLRSPASRMRWRVVKIEGPNAQVDLVHGSILGPQWEKLSDLEVVR